MSSLESHNHKYNLTILDSNYTIFFLNPQYAVTYLEKVKIHLPSNSVMSWPWSFPATSNRPSIWWLRRLPRQEEVLNSANFSLFENTFRWVQCDKVVGCGGCMAGCSLHWVQESMRGEYRSTWNVADCTLKSLRAMRWHSRSTLSPSPSSSANEYIKL